MFQFFLAIPLEIIGIAFFSFISLVFFIHNDKFYPSTGILTLAYVILDWLLNWKMSIYIYNNPSNILSYFFLYCIIGVLISGLKFKLKLIQKRKEYQDQKNKFYKNNKDSVTSDDEMRKDWEHECRIYDLKPKLSSFKYLLIGWICYWPFVLIDFIFKDALYNIFNSVYNLFSLLFKKIYQNELGKFDG